MNLAARDCSPLDPPPSREESEWLRQLQKAVRPADHIVGLGNERDDDEAVVYCERDGTWWAGRYVGSLTFAGSRLTIVPRFGINTLRSWLFQVTNLAFVESPGELHEDEAFIVQLLAVVWARSFVDAARHGLPALRKDVRFTGNVMRGRLDVAGTAALMASGSDAVLSVRRERSLDNAVSRAIVAAYAVLRRWMGPGAEDRWLPSRAQDLLPHLQAATGARPAVPSKVELLRARHTPITAPFRQVAELSRQIANRRGLSSDATPEGACQGVLLDVAELWELYVLAVLRQSAAGCDVRHGTLETIANNYLLRSMVDGQSIGLLKPDAVVLRRRNVVGIVDAKYKRLTPSAASPSGVQREDLYQLASYVTRFGREGSDAWGALVFPKDGDVVSPAERRSPWLLEGEHRVAFLTLPHNLKDAALKFRTFMFTDEARTRARIIGDAR